MPRPKQKQKPVERGRLDHDVKARIDADLYEQLRRVALREARSESAIMRLALRYYLGEVA